VLSTTVPRYITNHAIVLDPTRRSNDAREFESAMRRKIVGQDQAVDKVVEIYQMFLADLGSPNFHHYYGYYAGQ
jgi:hypothetical protein